MKKSICFFKHLILNWILVLAITTLTTANGFGQIPLTYWDTINFEQDYQYLVFDTSIQNIWQRAIPNKSNFDSAHSSEYAVITATEGFYPSNNHSYFDLLIGNFNYPNYYPYDVCLRFAHKFDTDTLMDGGYITVSYDKGETWVNIINDTLYPYEVTPSKNDWLSNENLYSDADVLFNGEFGYSGNSNGWVYSTLAWHYIPSKKSGTIEVGDTMILRFNFVSDETDNSREGWMIDDIILFARDLPGATHTTDISDKVRLHPNPVNDLATITLDRDYNHITASLLTSDGRTICQANHHGTDKFTINTTGLAPGVYFVNIGMDGEFVAVKKVVR